MTVLEFVFTRWTRYSHDRVYAAQSDGTAVGWLDLKTGVVTAEAVGDQAALGAHPLAYCAVNAITVKSAPTQPAPH